MSAVHGLLLEVSGPEDLLAVARRAKDENVEMLDAYSPFPVEDLTEAMGNQPSRLPWLMLLCGILGGLLAFGTMTFSAVVHYPFNVGGRPQFSWPAFVPVTFEMVILSASLGGVFFLTVFCRLPRYHHPVFNDRRFRESEQAGFFLMLADDEKARTFLEANFAGKWKEVTE